MMSDAVVFMDPCDIASAVGVCAISIPDIWSATLRQSSAPGYVANLTTRLLRQEREGSGTLDMRRIVSGPKAAALRRSVFHECLLRMIPAHSSTPNDQPSDGESIVAGSFALYEYIRHAEGRAPDWTPGDIDVWVPNWLLPDSIEQQFRQSCHARMQSIKIDRRSPSDLASDVPQMSYSTVLQNRADGVLTRGPGCVISSVTDFYVQDGGSATTDPIKVSFIAIMPDAGPYGDHPPVTTESIVGRFDLDICRVAMRVNRDTGARTFHVDDAVELAITQRRGRVMYHDNPRLATRVDKYRERGFVFDSNL